MYVFGYADDIIYIPFQQGVDMGHWGPSASSSKYSIYIFAITGDTGEPITVPLSCL